jgi:Bacterial PH domain
MARDVYAELRPRFVRYVAWGAIVVIVLGGLLVLWQAPGTDGRGYEPADALGTSVVLVAGCVFLWRQATVRARVDEHGVTVRNLLRVRTLEWTQVLAVRFGSGDPWVLLEISDGTTWPVMAVQRADGEYAVREARRLAALVVRHGEGQEQDGSGPAL